MKNSGNNIRILILNDNETEVGHLYAALVTSELSFDIEHTKKQSEFIKKLIKQEPDVIIARPLLNKYAALDIYDDVRKALPFAYFILEGSHYSKEEMTGFMLSGIDYFLPAGVYDILRFIVIQGFNKKHLEKSIYESRHLLNETNQQLRSIFYNDQNAVLIIGFKNEVIDFNPAAQELLGIKNSENFKGTDVVKYIDKAEIKKFRTAHATSFRGKKNTGEFTLNISKTIKKQVTINFVPIKNEDGVPVSVILICKDVTEAYLFRQKFRLSEERFMALANNAPIGIYFNNIDGRCVFVNKKWTDYTGLSFRESLGKGWMKCIHPDDREYVMRQASENRIKNAELSIDFRALHTSGEVKWLRGKTSPFIDDKGKLQGYIGTVANITNDKLHSLEMTEAQKRQNTLMNLANIALWEIDLSLEEYTPKWSENLFTLFEREISMGAPSNREFLYTYVHPDDRDFVRSLIKNYDPGTTTDDFFYRAITPSGNLKYLRALVTSENDLEGKPNRVLGFIQDITSLRQREEELKLSEEKFRYIFNHSPDGIYIEDLDGNILEVNEQACLIQDMQKEELVGKNIIDLAPVTIGEEIKKKFNSMAKGDISMLHSYSWNKSGKRIPVQIKQNHITYNMKPALLLHVRKLEI